ncbi:hypothetical protein AVEN_157862-1 [Araneus ventricosus]|uniref:Uncharacterized protein n=1 Tax=Araneus ventricosus TaxID=182803 RepID=A0A4Y2E8F0_ARAVE|nr:hypothetical protein AVEN_157862-1 [Araneus ventricosus]
MNLNDRPAATMKQAPGDTCDDRSNRTPPRITVPDAMTATEPVGRTREKVQYFIVFQAELVALQKAIDYATNIAQQPTTTLVDNSASVLVSANPESRNPIARSICRNLIQFRIIQVFWIKAHVGYDGHDEADRLAE